MARPVAETFTYDLDGNLTTDGLWTYTYDAENHLRSMYSALADQTGSKLALLFTYDYIVNERLSLTHLRADKIDPPCVVFARLRFGSSS